MVKAAYFLFISLLMQFTYSPAQENHTVEKHPLSTDEFNETGGCNYFEWFVFSSDRQDGGYLNYTKLFTLFVSMNGPDQQWTNPEFLSIDILSDKYDGCPVFTNEDRKMFTTLYDENPLQLLSDNKKTVRAGIYIRNNEDGRWSKTAKEFTFNKKGHFVGHPTLTTNGTKIFYAADFDDSYGGTDLYYSILINDKWSEPINLGNTVNSEGNELFPFYHRDNILYFSSDGHGSAGKLDIFYSEFRNGRWLPPVPLGSPVNSQANDFGIIVHPDNDRGVFTSDRDGTLDIFTFISVYPSFINCTEAGAIDRCISLNESGTMNLDTTKMQYNWNLGDGTEIKGEKAEHCYEKDGIYTISLDVTDKITGEFEKGVASESIEISAKEGLYFDIRPNGIVNKPVTITNVENLVKDYSPTVWYWDFGDGTKGTGKDMQHTWIRQGEFIVRLGIIKDENNIRESQKFCVWKKIKITR
ncbi:MAG: PKD domain-containing protein [Bacteroidota bacterium]